MTSKQIKGDTPIADIANAWGVNEKTVSNWVEFIYQGFDVLLPNQGPFPSWAVELLNYTAKHVSQKASVHFTETGERRRLRGAEFIAKVRRLRASGQFAELQKFQKSQKFQSEDLADELLAEVGAITRSADEELQQIQKTIAEQEDHLIEEVASFIEDAPRRKTAKLLNRLQAGRQLRSVQETPASIGEAIDVSYSDL